MKHRDQSVEWIAFFLVPWNVSYKLKPRFDSTIFFLQTVPGSIITNSGIKRRKQNVGMGIGNHIPLPHSNSVSYGVLIFTFPLSLQLLFPSSSMEQVTSVLWSHLRLPYANWTSFVFIGRKCRLLKYFSNCYSISEIKFLALFAAKGSLKAN